MAGSLVSVVAVAVAVVVVVVAAVGFVEAQQPDCASKLATCAEFLKSNNPPATCCNPIKEAVATQLDCLCNLYTSPDFFSSIGVNVSDALHLTKACGVPVDLAKCKSTTVDSFDFPQFGSLIDYLTEFSFLLRR